MLGCEDDGAHSRLLGKGRNLICIEIHRIKLVCSSCIPVREDSGKRLDLLAVSVQHRLIVPDSSKYGVQTEMYEHRVFVILPLSECFGIRHLCGSRCHQCKNIKNCRKCLFHI